MVTQVMIAAEGKDEKDVKTTLLAAWAALKEHTGGEWEIEREDVHGMAGFLTVRRADRGE